MTTVESSLSETFLHVVPSKWQMPLLVATSFLFFLGILFASTLSVKELSERVPARARSDDFDSVSEEEEELETPRKALFDATDSEDDDEDVNQTPKRKKKKELGTELTPHGRRSRRLQQTAEKKYKSL